MARQQAQANSLQPRLEWRVCPPFETGVLLQAVRSRVVGDVRVVDSRGSVVYGFRVLSGMEVGIRLTLAGRGLVRVRTTAGGLAVRRVRGGVQQQTIVVRVPSRPPVQTLQVVLEAARRGQLRLYILEVVASDRDEDGDGIGDAVERLLGAPASALRPPAPATSRDTDRLVLTLSPPADLAIDGEIQPEPFASAYLHTAALVELFREAGSALWLAIDPSPEPPRSLAETQRRHFQQAVAALMTAGVAGYEVSLPTKSHFNLATSEYTAMLFSLQRACEAITQQPTVSVDAGVEGIGMLVGDQILAGQSEPTPASAKDWFTLGAMLVNAGIPLTVHSLQRLPRQGLPRGVRLLIWALESVQPRDEAELRALAEWVRSGGWLCLAGGANRAHASNGATPIQQFAQALGIPIETQLVVPEATPPEAWRVVGRHGTEPAPSTINRSWVDIDLSPFAGQTVFVKFSDSLPHSSGGALLRQVRLEADGRTLAAFFTGTPAELLFLYTHSNSRLNPNGERFAERDAWFVYRFPLPEAKALLLRLELAQEWQVELSTQPPYRERVVEPARPNLPLLSLRNDETLTLYRAPNAEVFYVYQGAPVGASVQVGRGGVAWLGVPGKAFGNTHGGARQWRAIVQYLCTLAGLRYRERARIVARRGDWVAVYGTYRTTPLRGTYLDVLDPRLPILNDPQINPRMARLFLQMDARLRTASLLHTNAQVLLRHETPNQLAYLVRGPAGTTGVARFSLRGLRGQVSLTDTLGNPLPVNAEREGNTLLVRWNLSPSGQVLTLR
ncbi:MAG: hypothetical protein RMJ83_06235 [Armatimonadota bacterium]|nr:hypothetical protein [Armatimonadota bacterium]